MISGVLPHHEILDIGCGTGKSSDYFIRNDFKVCALDPGREMLAVCKQKYATYPNLSFVESDFEKWNQGDIQFDLVLSGTAFHWVSEDGKPRLRNLIRGEGHVCIFWHTFLNSDDQFSRRLDQIYKEFVPEMWVEDINAFQELTDAKKVRSTTSLEGFRDWRTLTYYENHYWAPLKSSYYSVQSPDFRFFLVI